MNFLLEHGDALMDFLKKKHAKHVTPPGKDEEVYNPFFVEGNCGNTWVLRVSS